MGRGGGAYNTNAVIHRLLKVGNNEHIGLVLHMEEELKQGGLWRFRCIHEGSDKGPGADLEFGNGGSCTCICHKPHPPVHGNSVVQSSCSLCIN